jgi:hypothetical protein
MNKHNPPTESEVRASLWNRCERLQGRLDERTQQRDDLLDMLIEMCLASDLSGRDRQAVKDRALRLIQVTREEMEVG